MRKTTSAADQGDDLFVAEPVGLGLGDELLHQAAGQFLADLFPQGGGQPDKAAAVAIGDDIAFFGHQAVGFLGGVGVDAGLGGQLAAAGHGVAVLHSA